MAGGFILKPDEHGVQTMNTMADNIEAVSYTHLDVYKRQTKSIRRLGRFINLLWIRSVTRHMKGYAKSMSSTVNYPLQ